MNRILLTLKRPFIWLYRFRHRCGYGVHSPFAFNLITHVIYESTAYYKYEELAKAVQMGTFQGDNGALRPNQPITREQAFAVLARAFVLEAEDTDALNTFPDKGEVSSWAANAVAALVENGYVTGSNGKLNPKSQITRAEFATIAVRFFDLSYQGEDLFPDIDGHWAQDYINQAADAGIIEGYPDGTFGPQKQITRAEAVTMVNRTLDRHPDPDHFLKDMLVWPDNLDTEAWYYADMQEATNSHEYQMKEDAQGNEYEVWTKILPIRDWEALEKEWSDANSSENPGDVV